MLCGSLELASRNVISGAVRMGYSVIYSYVVFTIASRCHWFFAHADRRASLFLGFGLAIGAEIYHQISGKTVVNASDFVCGYTHNATGPWYQRTPSSYWGKIDLLYCMVWSWTDKRGVA